MSEKLVKIYVDVPIWGDDINVDDFIVAVGVKQSNSVYHVAEVRKKKNKPRWKRFYIKAYKSDLPTCLRRDSTQKLRPMQWYKRGKK